jgi:hypothetical protein
MIKRENENVNFNVTPPKENTVLFFPPILESQAPTSSIKYKHFFIPTSSNFKQHFRFIWEAKFITLKEINLSLIVKRGEPKA